MDNLSTTTSEASPTEEQKSTLHSMKETVREQSQVVAAKADEYRESAATRLDQAASALRSRGDKTRDFAWKTGERFEAAASYMRSHNPGDMLGDCEEFVQRHPMKSLLASLMVGFLLGRTITR